MISSRIFVRFSPFSSRNLVQKRFLATVLSPSTHVESENVKKRRMEIAGLKIRENPVVMKLDTPQYRAIFTEELEVLIGLFKKYDFELRLAGGPVRDLLMEKIPSDLDFATTATPSQMKEIFTKEGIRMINSNGERHGTITPRINDKANYEITTLRIDVRTDGRHAEVEFTRDWLLDANRRDLTINSMFLGMDGTVYDYFYGYEDLMKRKVRFVGDAATRIQEDYLRILRYFRFYGRIATSPDDHEDETLRIIKENAAGLAKISGERIWMEFKKILGGNFACELTETMLKTDLGQYIGFSEHPNIAEFKRLWSKKDEFAENYHHMTLTASLVNSPEEAIKLHERLKFSAYERDLLYFIVANREQMSKEENLIPFQQMCIQTIAKPSDQRGYVEELVKYLGKVELYKKLHAWEIPFFPVNGTLLKENGCPPGKWIGIVINKLKQIWAANEFKSTQEELMKHLPEILKELNIEDGQVKKKPKINKD
ncbi:CCA tRNA nucleotidyltransferase 1, mitochondrial [Culicoides brevitarsis]|uniref:CCA tRNA nucleotidyltransferase 1, mitochondrial n=1 Tax=Culicoides brevitarsis TaxID=469753 RepID=UPI00307CC505